MLSIISELYNYFPLLFKLVAYRHSPIAIQSGLYPQRIKHTESL